MIIVDQMDLLATAATEGFNNGGGVNLTASGNGLLNGANHLLTLAGGQQSAMNLTSSTSSSASTGDRATPSLLQQTSMTSADGFTQQQQQPAVSVILTVRLLMQGKEVGSIIGKRGDHVKLVRDTSGAKINISDGSCPERIVTITGNTATVNKAFGMIAKKFEEDLQSLPNSVPKPPITMRLIVPATQCGSLIGKGGSKIKEIREVLGKTGASLQVATEMLPNSTERAVTISGTCEALTDCLQEICHILLEAPAKGGTLPFRPKPSYNPLLVASSAAAAAAAQQQANQHITSALLQQQQQQQQQSAGITPTLMAQSLTQQQHLGILAAYQQELAKQLQPTLDLTYPLSSVNPLVSAGAYQLPTSAATVPSNVPTSALMAPGGIGLQQGAASSMQQQLQLNLLLQQNPSLAQLYGAHSSQLHPQAGTDVSHSLTLMQQHSQHLAPIHQQWQSLQELLASSMGGGLTENQTMLSQQQQQQYIADYALSATAGIAVGRANPTDAGLSKSGGKTGSGGHYSGTLAGARQNNSAGGGAAMGSGKPRFSPY